jgi:hypothetical protein
MTVWDGKLKVASKETRSEYVDWVGLRGDPVAGSCEHVGGSFTSGRNIYLSRRLIHEVSVSLLQSL